MSKPLMLIIVLSLFLQIGHAQKRKKGLNIEVENEQNIMANAGPNDIKWLIGTWECNECILKDFSNNIGFSSDDLFFDDKKRCLDKESGAKNEEILDSPVKFNNYSAILTIYPENFGHTQNMANSKDGMTSQSYQICFTKSQAPAMQQHIRFNTRFNMFKKEHMVDQFLKIILHMGDIKEMTFERLRLNKMVFQIQDENGTIQKFYLDKLY